MLLAKGADVNARNNKGETPLHLAASFSGNTDIIKLLLVHGAKVTLMANDGKTPLHYAAWNASPNATKLLPAHGADVDARDNAGLTPLQMTVGLSRWAPSDQLNKDVVGMLRQHGGHE